MCSLLLPSNLLCMMHQIQKLKCFLSCSCLCSHHLCAATPLFWLRYWEKTLTGDVSLVIICWNKRCSRSSNCDVVLNWSISGPRFNDRVSRYRNSHYNDNAVVRPRYLYNGNSYTGKTIPLYWNISRGNDIIQRSMQYKQPYNYGINCS